MPKIVEILSGPERTNSSYGNWSVWVRVKTGWVTCDEPRYFWRKKEAQEFIQRFEKGEV